MNKKQMAEMVRELTLDTRQQGSPIDFVTVFRGILQVLSEVIERLPDDEQIEPTDAAQPSSDT